MNPPEPSWRLGALATTAGLCVFAWGLARGGGDPALGARVSAWPRSSEAAGSSYAVQLVAVDGRDEQVQSRVHAVCNDEPLDTDESGWLLFSEPGALPSHTCRTAVGTVTFDAPQAPLGTESLAEPVRARTTGVGLRGPAPDVYLEDSELTIDAPTLAWLRLPAARGQELTVDPEPGLEARVVGPCEEGFVLELRATYHVTGLHLQWGPLTARERLDVVTPVSHGGPALRVSRDPNGVQYATIQGTGDAPVVGGWLALFDAHGLISSVTSSNEPWSLPRLRADGTAVLVGTRGSFFDSASTRVRIQPETDTCARARRLERPWPAPHAAVVVADGVEPVRVLQQHRTARGKRTAGFGLAGGLVGLAAALLGVRNARMTARALAAFAIALTLFGVLAMLLYAS